MKKIYGLLMAVSFIIAFSAIEAFTQKGGKGRYRKVPLVKDARTNGYKVTEQGRKEYYLQIFGAEHPITKRRLSAQELVEYRCREMLKEIERKIFFNDGNTEPFKIECAEADLTVKPQILLLDESNGIVSDSKNTIVIEQFFGNGATFGNISLNGEGAGNFFATSIR